MTVVEGRNLPTVFGRRALPRRRAVLPTGRSRRLTPGHNDDFNAPV